MEVEQSLRLDWIYLFDISAVIIPRGIWIHLTLIVEGAFLDPKLYLNGEGSLNILVNS